MLRRSDPFLWLVWRVVSQLYKRLAPGTLQKPQIRRKLKKVALEKNRPPPIKEPLLPTKDRYPGGSWRPSDTGVLEDCPNDDQNP